MNFRSWQRWQLIEYALLLKISEEKAVENGKALPQTKQELLKKLFHCKLPNVGVALIKSDCIFSVGKEC